MPTKSQSIVLAGVAIGVAAAILALIPSVGSCLACIAYICAGLLAVWHYTDRHTLTLKGGQGAGLGSLAGIVAVVVAAVLGYLFSFIGLTPPFRQAMEEQLSASGMDPAQMEQFMELMSSPLFFVGMTILGIIIGAIGGAIGGVIGASVFKKGDGFFEESTE